MFHVLVLTYTQPLDVVDQARAAHVAWVKEQVDAGLLILAGRQDTKAGGVLVTSDIDVSVAEKMMAEDPYQAAGVVSYQRIGFDATLRGPGL